MILIPAFGWSIVSVSSPFSSCFTLVLSRLFSSSYNILPSFLFFIPFFAIFFVFSLLKLRIISSFSSFPLFSYPSFILFSFFIQHFFPVLLARLLPLLFQFLLLHYCFFFFFRFQDKFPSHLFFLPLSTAFLLYFNAVFFCRFAFMVGSPNAVSLLSPPPPCQLPSYSIPRRSPLFLYS